MQLFSGRLRHTVLAIDILELDVSHSAARLVRYEACQVVFLIALCNNLVLLVCLQKLAAARQEEFERWKGHLVGLEAALQAAQKEATDYRYAGAQGCRVQGAMQIQ